MSQVHGDPEKIEQFASELQRFNANLNESLSRLNAQFSRLGDTWKDREHSRYAKEFEQTIRLLRQFQKSTEQQVPLLRKKARKLREYLS